MKMKTSLNVLGLSLFSLCVANVLQRGPQAADSLGNPLGMEASTGYDGLFRASTVEITDVHTDIGTYDPSTGLSTH